MGVRLATVTLVVPDYDEAIEYFVSVLKFRVLEDTDLGDGKRWVLVAPVGSDDTNGPGAQLLLAKADTQSQRAAIGSQSGGRVSFFLETTQFDVDYQSMVSLGVDFQERPRNEPYGKVVVFADKFGNRWDLIQKQR